MIALDLKGLACSTGAACSSGAVEPSHVLTAIGLPADEARASVRFSLGRHTTLAEIEFALQVVPAAVAQLRELSPTYRNEAKAEARREQTSRRVVGAQDCRPSISADADPPMSKQDVRTGLAPSQTGA